MSLRFFEGDDHAKYYVQFRPVPPPTLVNRLVEFLQEKYNGPLDQAVDLGCGNGQCTFTLANNFTSVLGTDISPAQIKEANESCVKLKRNNVRFQASPGEVIPVEDKSAQLVTICEAAHYMDLPKVYEEAKRVLVPGGVLAIIGYHFPVYVPPEEDKDKSDAIKEAVDKAVNATLPWFAEQSHDVLKEYSKVTIPFSDFTRERGFAFTKAATLDDMEGIIRSYSPFQNMCKAQGIQVGDAVLSELRERITEILNNGRQAPMTPDQLKEYQFIATWNYFVLMAHL